MVELVDTSDLKSDGFAAVPVQVRPPAPTTFKIFYQETYFKFGNYILELHEYQNIEIIGNCALCTRNQLLYI